MKQRLWHASDQEDIQVFAPRPIPTAASGEPGGVVWAIDETRLVNYLLPRECPRVCFWRGPKTTDEDVARFLGATSHSIVVEDRWMTEIRSSSIWLYELPRGHFKCLDENAGYYTSAVAVKPIRKEHVNNLPVVISARGAELKATGRLLELAAAVESSSLAFSIIRLRNASHVPNAA